MEKWSMKSARFWTPSWTDAVDQTIGYTTWYTGQVMKELMRRLHGFQPETLPIHWNSTSYSTSDILTSQAPENSKKESPITYCITARQAPARFFSFSFSFSILQFFSPFFLLASMFFFPLLFIFSAKFVFSSLFCSRLNVF